MARSKGSGIIDVFVLVVGIVLPGLQSALLVGGTLLIRRGSSVSAQ